MNAQAPPSDFDMDKRYVGVIRSYIETIYTNKQHHNEHTRQEHKQKTSTYKRSYNETKGMGFIASEEISRAFGCDVFLHASQRLPYSI